MFWNRVPCYVEITYSSGASVKLSADFQHIRCLVTYLWHFGFLTVSGASPPPLIHRSGTKGFDFCAILVAVTRARPQSRLCYCNVRTRCNSNLFGGGDNGGPIIHTPLAMGTAGLCTARAFLCCRRAARRDNAVVVLPTPSVSCVGAAAAGTAVYGRPGNGGRGHAAAVGLERRW